MNRLVISWSLCLILTEIIPHVENLQGTAVFIDNYIQELTDANMCTFFANNCDTLDTFIIISYANTPLTVQCLKHAFSVCKHLTVLSLFDISNTDLLSLFSLPNNITDLKLTQSCNFDNHII